jgi:glycosyltransferase involved in cell wall biosynthesis
MKISIVVTTYNGEKYIKEQIDSFLSQTLSPDEIIITDDCSSDKTIKIVEKYKENYSDKIKIFQNQYNLGFTKNFQEGIKKSSGDIIFLSDQDDLWYENKIEIVVKKFNSNPNVDLIIHDADLVNENLKFTNYSVLSQVISGFNNTDVFITGALTAFKKNLVKYFLPFPKNLVGHDGFIHFVSKNLNTRIVINDKLQMIRRHADNTSGWVASSLKKINKFDVFKQQFFSKRVKHYNDRLEQVIHMINILEKLRSEKHNFSEETLLLSLNKLKNERVAIRKRNLLEKKNFFERKVIAFELLIKNQYKYFNGYKSFIRDILR